MGLYIILMGVQGAGKGMQASFIRQQYGIPNVSTGDLFRAMRERDDDLARHVQDLMKQGLLIPDDLTNQVVQDRLEQADAKNGVILDGYPRSPGQAEWLDRYLAGKGEAINAVLLMELDLYEAFKRAFGRVTAASGESYNVYSNAEGIEWAFVDHPEQAYPPRLEAKHSASGEQLKRRPDDASAHAIIKRIDLFIETTQPLIEYYSAKGLLERIDASKSIQEVSAAIQQILEAAQK